MKKLFFLTLFSATSLYAQKTVQAVLGSKSITLIKTAGLEFKYL